MNTSIIKFDYNGNIIPFEKGSDVMVNLYGYGESLSR